MRRSTVDSTTDRAVGFENSAYLFIDSNILYPIRLADLVLWSVDDGLFEVEDLLNEIERVLIDTKGVVEMNDAGFEAVFVEEFEFEADVFW